MRRLLLLLPLLLCLTAAIPPAQAQGPRYETRIRLNLYAPAIVKLEYEYTRNITVGDVSSLGPSLYEVRHSPEYFQFSTEDIDQFTWTLELQYGVRMRQVMRLTIFSGSTPPNTIELPVEAQELIINFEVTVQPEPRYPTSDEIAERLMSHLMGTLEGYHGENQRIFRALNRTIAFYGALAALNVVAIVAVVALLYKQMERGGYK